jgi:hypothetical protein
MDNLGGSDNFNLNSLMTSTPLSYALPIAAAVGAAYSPTAARGVGGALSALQLGSGLYEKRAQQKRLTDAMGQLAEQQPEGSPARTYLQSIMKAPLLSEYGAKIAADAITPHKQIMRGDTAEGPVYEIETPKFGQTRLSQIGNIAGRPSEMEVYGAQQKYKTGASAEYPKTAEDYALSLAEKNAEDIGQFGKKADITGQRQEQHDMRVIQAQGERQLTAINAQADRQQTLYDRMYDREQDAKKKAAIGDISSQQKQLNSILNQIEMKRQADQKALLSNPFIPSDTLRKQYPGETVSQLSQRALNQLHDEYDAMQQDAYGRFIGSVGGTAETYQIPLPTRESLLTSSRPKMQSQQPETQKQQSGWGATFKSKYGLK